MRATVLILGIPTSIIGSLLLMNGARYIRHDLSLVVEELLEEQEEQRKRADEGARTPVLQVANIDFSYGPVQVLFDVNFEIHRGECVALLGTNGAGKSTILRVISGLEVPERGVVRLNGRNITYVAPESARAARASCSCPAARACSRASPIAQNLGVSARLNGGTKREIEQRIDDDARAVPRARASARSSPRAASRAASSRCSRSRGCSCTIPRSC